jgi:hypothetical protein
MSALATVKVARDYLQLVAVRSSVEGKAVSSCSKTNKVVPVPRILMLLILHFAPGKIVLCCAHVYATMVLLLWELSAAYRYPQGGLFRVDYMPYVNETTLLIWLPS